MRNIRAKKSLGQNFLKSKKVLDKIVDVSDLNEKDIVVEVGPGKGALTSKILEKGVSKLIVVEKDDRMIDLLEKKFAEYIKKNQLEIINDDILEFDFEKYNLKKNKYKIIANLPYYITGKFLRQTLGSGIYPSLMTLLLQKEVVERITTRRLKDLIKNNKKENILSLSVKAYGDPYYVTSVSAKNFIPAPKVDSAVLLVKNISKDFFKKNDLIEEEFFNFIKNIFSSKRKKMIKNIISSNDYNNITKEYLNNIFTNLKIDINSRAEDLNLEEILKIYLKIIKKNTIIKIDKNYWV